MGGNAFDNIKINRMDIETYEQIKQIILDKLSPYLNLYPYLDPPDKKDFGDVDMVYIKKDSNIILTNLLKDIFNPIDIKINGRTTSWIYELNKLYYQIDFNHCSDDNLLSMFKFYFSYGDLGGIIGRLASYYCLKFGQNGLYLNLLDDTLKRYQSHSQYNEDEFNKSDIHSTKGVIILTSEPKLICEYLDLDWNKYTSGFSSNIEIYDWICKSKLFNPDIYVRLNNQHRKRYKIRPFYQEFRNYILNNDPVLNASESELTINYQLEALIHFNKINELDKIIEEHNIKQKNKSKFNGKILIDLGIEPKLINQTTKILKEKLYQELKLNDIIEHNWNLWLESQSHEDIYNWIKNNIN